jgi:hypothetical protein
MEHERRSTNTGYSLISRLNNGRYLLSITEDKQEEVGQQKKSSKSLIELVQWRNAVYGHDFGEEMPGIEGVYPVEEVGLTRPVPKARGSTGTELWARAIENQERQEAKIEDPWYPIMFDGYKPFGVAFMSDMHIGSPFVNYKLLMEHSQIIQRTPGLHLIVLGDERDNFVGTRLNHARYTAQMSVEDELRLYMAWMNMVQDDTLAYVTGNHDLWTWKMAGVDLADLLLPETVLYDKYEVRIAINLNDLHTWQLKLRHRWSGRSIYNLTNGIERAWQFGRFDIGVGADYHDGTICREFIKDGQIRYAILLGTYKNLDDPYHKQIGKIQSPHMGCGMILFFPDGKMQWFRDLETGADYLSYLRGE